MSILLNFSDHILHGLVQIYRYIQVYEIFRFQDPTCVMFFEPMLTVPLNRNYPFSLQQLCRSVIVSKITYDGISMLGLPSALKSYLREYHYKQKVRVKRFDDLCMA